MSGPSAAFKAPRLSAPPKAAQIYKDRSSVLSPAPAADWRSSPQQYASAPSSSFYDTQHSSSQAGAGRRGPYGAGGNGFNAPPRRSHEGADALLDSYGISLDHGPSLSSSSSTMQPPRSSHAPAQQSSRPAPHAPAQATSAYPWEEPVEAPPRVETARGAEMRRKREHEAAEADAEALQHRFDAAERLERVRRAGIAAARRAGATSSADPVQERPKTSVDRLFDKQKAATKPAAKDKGVEAVERAKERRSRDKDQVKGKKRVVALESDIEDSADDRSPRRKPHSAPAASRKLAGLRGHFDSAAPPVLSQSPSPEVVAEVLPTLEDMLKEEHAAERKRRKGKGRATSERDDERDSERVEKGRERSSRDEAFHYDALLDEDDDDLPDSSTLCPFCDTPLPDSPSPQLLATRAALLRHPHDRRPTLRNKDAVRFPEGEHVVRTAAFCKMHVDERTIVPEGRARGYPTSIKWDELPRRIDRELGAHLSDVIIGQVSSPFLARARDAWDAGEWKSVLSEYGSFDVEEPGYYGPRGLELIKQTLTALFVDESPLITPRRTAPLTVDFYLRRVLVPECAVELIRLDLASSTAPPSTRRDSETLRAQAERVRAESRAYGRAVFPHENEAEERREAAAAPALSQAVVPVKADGAGGAQGRSSAKRGRDERERERDEASPAKKKKKRKRVSSSSEDSDGIEVVERAPARVPKAVVAVADRAPATGRAFRVPKAQGQARSTAASAASSSASSSSSATPRAAALPSVTSARKSMVVRDDSDSDDELLIVSPQPPAPSPRKKDKKKKKVDKEHKDRDRDRERERKKHKKARRSSPASSPALGLFPPSSSLPPSSLAHDTRPTEDEAKLARLAAALDPSVDDDLAEVPFNAGSFARDNRKREAREKKERRDKKKRERLRKKGKGARGGGSSSSSSSDEA
ncbi:uncharacterized protein RHOBADRAFT_54311 [Rhodotorula graminis WP1]|uniref:Restriction of telomere capping protein 4 n=1 Tax=Rhodotorula graminis (strain WP1) TaxID=578459 RepID=A0A194S1W0_RHOGW|nr:uncharacterized protein RHOBADRAFT_54311 [Rhodotorula graminis WP1]KPV74499.1 hypothetical protein RHOBADRAFT_54311 [Rhodotorula graminis WP1]